jgi:hypothetical protein
VQGFPAAVSASIARGLLEVGVERVRLTADGRLLANEVLVAFLPDCAAGAAAG